MDEIIRISFYAAIVVVLALSIKKISPQMAIMISLVALVCVSFYIIPMAADIKRYLESIIKGTGMDAGVFAPLFKICIISVISKISSDVCRDAGENALSSKIEIAGAVIAIVNCIPLFDRVLSMIASMV